MSLAPRKKKKIPLSHRCFPFVLGINIQETPRFLVMEYCGFEESKSSTILSMLKGIEKMHITDSQWLHILGECCDGFKYLHSLDIIHCDIKSDNIMLMPDKNQVLNPKIGDFNKARYLSKSMTKAVLPHPLRDLYKRMHPQNDPGMYDGLYPYCKETDIYSFGFMLKQMVKVIGLSYLANVAMSCMQ